MVSQVLCAGGRPDNGANAPLGAMTDEVKRIPRVPRLSVGCPRWPEEITQRPGGGRRRRAAHPCRRVVGASSLATDLGTGQPLEHAMRTAVLAVRLGELAGASAQELSDAYYVALLHSFGCTSDGHEAAHLYGDDIVPRAAFALVDSGNFDEVLAFFRSNVGVGAAPDVRAAMIEQAVTHGPEAARQTLAMHCEVAQRFAGWLGFSDGTRAALEFGFERWDGLGLPGVVRGDEIPLPMRLVHVARDFSVFLSAAGSDDATAMVKRRSGAAYEPASPIWRWELPADPRQLG